MSVTRISLTVLVVTVSLVGCAKTPIVMSAAPPAPSGPAPASRVERRPPAPASRPTTVAERPPVSKFRTLDVLRDVHFDFDRYDIRTDDAKVLDADAAWLNDNAHTLVLIEGHADERGTDEYNLALGERRAKAALDYLMSRGVRGTRISVLSYGEERPLCVERTEACWVRNRRAHFLVKSEETANR
jgi:peptidoglycan-associated lipoprotein